MSLKINFSMTVILGLFLGMGALVRAQDNALALSSALDRALENNYGIIISESQVDIAEMNNNWGTAGRYPSVGFDASSTNSGDILNHTSNNRLNGSVGMNWTLFDGYRITVTKDKLEKLEALAEGRSAVVVENTIQNVILGYYNVLLQEEQLEILREVMALSRDRHEYEKMRRALGSALTYQVLQAKNVYLEDSAAFLNQQVVLRNAIRNLNFTIGEEPSARWNFSEKFEADTSRYNLGDLLDKMQSDNQTLQNQYVNLLLSREEIRLKESDLYPSLRVSAGLDNSWSRFKNDRNDPAVNKTLSPFANLTLSYDIYTGGTRKRAVEIAKINEEIAQTEQEEMEHSLTNLLYNAYDLYNVRRTLLHIADENLEAAELNLDIAGEKFKNGAINSFNYRDIQLIYLHAALQRLRSVYNLIDSKTNLTRMTGGFVNPQP